jgi:hypothetical protein
MIGKPWARDEINSIKQTLAEHSSIQSAAAAHNLKWKTHRTYESIQSALKRRGMPSAQNYLRPTRRHDDHSENELLANLVRFCKKAKGRASLTYLCDSMDMSPKRIKILLEYARSKGKTVNIAHDQVSMAFEAPAPNMLAIRHLPIEPVNDEIVFLAASDSHSGSLHARPACFKDAVEIAYNDYGVRRGFHSGDVFDGLHVYKGQASELSGHTLEAQLRSAEIDIPKMPGLEWDIIGGNHDEDFLKDNGSDAIARLGELRPDIRTHGYYMTMANIGPSQKPEALKVELFHPGGGIPYARSYPLQKAIEKIPGGMKPHILLSGHLHYEFTMFYRGVFGVQVPCFQDQTLLGKRMGAAPEIGCFIIKVGITKGCAIKTITVTRIMYFHASRGPVRCQVKDRDGKFHEERFERRMPLD